MSEDLSEETLESTYNRLDSCANEMFKDAFAYYDFWQEMRKEPLGKGSYHKAEDARRIKAEISSFDIKISDLY